MFLKPEATMLSPPIPHGGRYAGLALLPKAINLRNQSLYSQFNTIKAFPNPSTCKVRLFPVEYLRRIDADITDEKGTGKADISLGEGHTALGSRLRDVGGVVR